MDVEYVEPVVGWFSLSLIIAGLAKAMNRNGLLCSILGILTGPVALFILVVLGKEIGFRD